MELELGFHPDLLDARPLSLGFLWGSPWKEGLLTGENCVLSLLAIGAFWAAGCKSRPQLGD